LAHQTSRLWQGQWRTGDLDKKIALSLKFRETYVTHIRKAEFSKRN